MIYITLCGMFGLLMILYFVVGTIIASCTLCYVMRAKQAGLGNFLTGRSVCDHCDAQLRWYELIPVLSRVLQKGKCRSCKQTLGYKYLLTELFGGLLFLLLGRYLFMLPVDAQLYLGCIVGGLLTISLYDMYYHELDLKTYVITFAFIGLLYYALVSQDFVYWRTLVGQGAALRFVGWLLVRCIGVLAAKIKTGLRQEGFGFGDVLVGGLLGSLLPFVYMYIGLRMGAVPIPYEYIAFVIAAFVLTSLIASVLGIVGYLCFPPKESDYLPFLPYMIGGFLISTIVILKFGLFFI